MNNIKIGVKLIGGFVIVAIIASIIGIFGISKMKTIADADEKLYESITVPLSQIGIVQASFHQVRVNLRDMIRANDPEVIRQKNTRIDELSGFITTNTDLYEKTLYTEKGKKAFAEFQEMRKAFRGHLDKMKELAGANKDVEALALLDGDAEVSARAEQSAIEKMVELKIETGNEISHDNTKTYQQARNAMIAILVGGIVIALLLGILISTSITGPLQKGVTMMQEMVKGHLGTRLNMNRKDEIGLLAGAMDEFSEDLQNNVVATVKKIGDGDVSADLRPKDNQDEIIPAIMATVNNLRGLITEMSNMSKQHDLGEIDVVIAADKFQGAYREMGEGVNKMVLGHIAVKKKAMACIAEFGKGNLDATLEKFPGKKAFINENIEQLRANLKEFISQMRHMSEQHNLGDIDVVIPVDRFEGSFKVMSQGVNDMVLGHIAVKKKAMACIGEFGKGNFDAPLEKFPGKKAFINETIEGVRKNLKDIAAELITLIEASKNGALSTRGNAGAYMGDWQKMIRGVNEILDAILEPINEAAAVLEKVAARDMTVRVNGDYRGDHAKIKVSLNSAVKNLDEALTQVAEATEQVSSGSQQISAGSQNLAQGANEQASSLEEVSSSLEEMASMTKQNAENANQANNLSAEANTNAATGTEAMERMNTSINKIKESSDQTAKIVKTIDEIAMQTNLLALNAAVEAARAGEAGRGFAVVAEEVRNLAQRSADAAKNTANMIEESVKNAEEGVKISAEVSKSFGLIAGSAKKVNDLIAEIAAASQEQSTGIEQVNVAVSQMDKVTQQNAANSEESASAAEEMSSQAEELQSMIAQFTLSQSVHKKTVSSSAQKSQTTTLHQEHKKGAPSTAISTKNGGMKKHSKSSEVAKAGKMAAEAMIPMDDDALSQF